MRRDGGSERDKGAALVEMAILSPFLILLLLGGMEIAYLLAQQLDITHAARSAGRYAAVDEGNTPQIVALTCQALNDSSEATVTLAGSTVSLGGEISATVRRPTRQFTGFLSWAVPEGHTLSSSSTFLLEVSPPQWNDVEDNPC